MQSPLKIVFAGTPRLAQTILNQLLINGFKIELVLTKPDRFAGRGKHLSMSPVKQLALAHNLPILQPTSFSQDLNCLAKIKSLKPDIMVVVAYGLILPQQLLSIPRLGCINVHVSLLPSYRGAAPIQRAIMAGDEVSGVTIMQMDAGIDTGDILLQEKVAIGLNETAGELEDELALLGTKLTIKFLQNYLAIKPIPQQSSKATYAPKIDKSEAKINWQEDANIISRKVRGLNPFPGCFSYLKGELIKIWQAAPTLLTTTKTPGSIINANKNGLMIACGEHTVLAVTQLQRSGKNRQHISQYLLGQPNLVGEVFGKDNENE